MYLSLTRRQLLTSGASTLALAAAARRAVAQAPAPLPEPLLAKDQRSLVSLVHGEDRRKNAYNALLAIDGKIAPQLKNKKYVIIKPNNVSTVNQLAARYEMSLQAVYKHLRVLEDAGVVSRPLGPQPRSVRLEAEVFDLMDSWIERYRRKAEERYRRLDAVLEAMNHDEQKEHNNERDR